MTTRLSADELLKITNCMSYDHPFFNILTSLTLTNKIDSRSEIERLGQIYSELAASSNDKIDRSTFRDMLADQFGVDDSLIMDRGVFDALEWDGYLELMQMHALKSSDALTSMLTITLAMTSS